MANATQTGIGIGVGVFGVGATILISVLAWRGVDMPTWAFILLLIASTLVMLAGAIYAVLPVLQPFITGLLLVGKPKISRVKRHDIVIAIRRRWHDDVGKPLVAVDEGRITHVWASLDVELRNEGQSSKRVHEIYLEIRQARFPKSLIATADPARVDSEEGWHSRRFRRRVEWLLGRASRIKDHHVRFDRGWPERDGPPDPKKFTAAVVANLSDGHQVRVELEEDIMGKQG